MFGESAIWVMNAHSTFFFTEELVALFLSPKLLPSSLARRLLLDKVYWTYTIILNFEDDLGSSIQFQKLIYTTSFKLRANNQHLDWVNPIPHKGIPSDWLPPFIADALNKVIGYTTKMTQKRSRYMSIERLYCEPSLELICLTIQFVN